MNNIKEKELKEKKEYLRIKKIVKDAYKNATAYIEKEEERLSKTSQNRQFCI